MRESASSHIFTATESTFCSGKNVTPRAFARSKYNRVATELYLFQEGKGKYRKNPRKKKNRDKMVIATKLGFGSRLSKGKVLAPLTSIVLDGTHLVILVINLLAYYLFALFIRLERNKKRFFI